MEQNKIPEMNIQNNYVKNPAIPEDSQKNQKDMEKTKKDVEKLKNSAIKKFPFIQAIGLLPPNSIKHFIEEEEVPKETEKYHHLVLLIPDEKEKEKEKIKKEIVKEIEKSEQKVWIQIFAIKELWEICLDSKFELNSAISMSYPLYDKGILGALRVAEIHKSMVVQKFEKYVVSYVIGGSLVRGDAIKTSDVDVFVIINDTDVKRMPRLELKERLRNIIYQYVGEASSLAGVKNQLEPQIYLLTDFWESVKDAHPVMFTFIRDGIPLYDRGTFMPWKALLKMGKLKPSPEAIDMFMSMGNEVVPRSKKFLLSEVFTNIFWGVTTPAQGIVMLNGLPPPNAKKELIPVFKKHFVETKMLEKKYVDFLEKIVKLWRDYEHRKIKEMNGTEIDKLLEETDDFIKRMKELRKQIEKKTTEKTIEQIYKDVMDLMKQVTGKKSQVAILESFERDFVKKSKFTRQHLRELKEIIKARTDYKKGKLDPHKVEMARKQASTLINDLIEYSQRKDLISLEKGKMKLKFKGKKAELLNADKQSFLFIDKKVKKITNKIEDSNMKEVSEALSKQKDKNQIEIKPKVFDLIKKEYGEFEISF